MAEFDYTTDEQIEKMREEIQKAKQKSAKKGRPKEAKTRLHILKVIRKVIEWTLFSITVVFLSMLLISILMAKSRGETPNLFGYQLFVIESGSMAPTLRVGAVILSVQPKDSEALQVDDIVTFKMESGAIVTHRVIEIVTDENGEIRYRTKGDNPINTPDLELLDPERVMARFIAKIPLT